LPSDGVYLRAQGWVSEMVFAAGKQELTTDTETQRKAENQSSSKHFFSCLSLRLCVCG
jgi:hypothetical protein